MLWSTREALRVRALVSLLAASVVLVLGACASGPLPAPEKAVAVPAQQQALVYPDVTTVSNISYGTADGQQLLLDVCLPADAAVTQRPAIIGVHGGSWKGGDKANQVWTGICRWLASEGYVTVSVNYRLAPTHTFPSQISDVRQAVQWLRDPAQVSRYSIDPARIGALGGSAGGNLVALLGTEGSGPLNTGTRVAAVVDLSGPADLTANGAATSAFQQTQLSYLGCADYSHCPAAKAASPVYQVDASDPPFFIAHSTNEFIPLAQATQFVAALRAKGVPTTFVTKPGTEHAVSMLDDSLRTQIAAFLQSTLEAPRGS
ncbi:MAG: alpha/beta hydrolase [Terrimesophilobacter sp.]